jgi:menaquinone-dependent protoporphyrinogen oxidase
MTVLVTAASKHGATYEIAEALVRELRSRDVDAEVMGLDEVVDPAAYEAVLLGSGVYLGRWLEEARDFVDRHEATLAARPVWLFSSGPLGDPPKPAPDKAVEIEEILSKTGAREHHLFTGRLDKSKLGLGERTIARAVHVQEGDFRDWNEVSAWAGHVAAALKG